MSELGSDVKEINSAFLDTFDLQIYQNSSFSSDVSSRNFDHNHFIDCGGKNKVFTDCRFSYCVMVRSYFHRCKFVNCKFIGARFVGCNFREAVFSGCDFSYARFESTLISSKEMIGNAPSRPNVKRELMIALRVNAQSIGNGKDVKLYVKEELSASTEHLKKAREQKETFYQDKYGGYKNWVIVRRDSIANWLDWHLWGHGEYPGKLMTSVFLLLIIVTVYVLLDSGRITGSTSITEAVRYLLLTSGEVVYTFLGIKQLVVSDGVAAVLALSRYIVMGLFIAVLYKWLSAR